MARYFARVELHEADEDDYETLHLLMAKENFTQCLKTTMGPQKLPAGSQKLPTGFYTAKLVENEVEVVAKAVKKRVDQIKLSNEVIVIKSAGSFSYLSEKC